MAKILMISGKKGSGKDLVGNILKARKYVRIAFADRLKELCAELYNYPVAAFHDRDHKDRAVLFSGNPETGEILPGKMADDKHEMIHISPRDMCIQLGSIGRDLNENIWVELTDIPETDVVITDWRFPGEYETLKAAGHEIYTIRVVRSGCALTECETETSLDDFDFDYIIPNTGSKGLVARFLGAILGDIDERKTAN